MKLFLKKRKYKVEMETEEAAQQEFIPGDKSNAFPASASTIGFF